MDVETYLPSFETTSKRKSSNVMERINVSRRTEGGDPISTGWNEQP